MVLWDAVTGTATFATRSARGVLRWAERVAPWPLSIVPRTLRVPLDVVAVFVDLEPPPAPAPEPVSPQPVSAPPRSAAREPARPRKPAPPAPREAARTRDDAGRAAGRGTQPAEHVASIAGVRSDGPDDAPQFDREVRARLAPLYVRDVGTGPAIVFLHAFPLNSRMWEPQIDELADRFRVLAPDFAGFGLSWMPESTLSLADQARAVELSLDDLKVEDFILVGLSMGGYVSFPLVARLGRRVRGLVLANTRATADDEETAASRHRLAAEVEASGVEAAADELLPKLIGTSTLRDQPELVDRVRAIILENKPAGVAGALRAMAARPDSTPMLSTIACPVLVIAGEDDVVTPVAEARRMASRIRDARVLVLPRAGHLSNLEAPVEFTRAVADFALTLPAMQAARAHAAGQTPASR